MNAIHIACGAGGITLGFERAGIGTSYAFDVSPIVVETHRVNFTHAPCDVRDIRETHAADLLIADVWTCGIPCEPYSLAGQQLKENDPRDIAFDVARLLHEARTAGNMPRYLFFENVPPFAGSLGAQKIRDALDGYSIFEATFNHADFGVPQTRRRWHLIASVSSPAPVPEPTHCENGPDLFGRQPWVRFGTIRNGTGIKPINVKAIRYIFNRSVRNAAKYGGGNAYGPQFVDDDDMLPTVLSSWSRDTARSQVVLVYDKGKLRVVSLIEARRGQGFPDDFSLCGKKDEQYQQVGRAVPPPFAEAVARAILKSVKGGI